MFIYLRRTKHDLTSKAITCPSIESQPFFGRSIRTLVSRLINPMVSVGISSFSLAVNLSCFAATFHCFPWKHVGLPAGYRWSMLLSSLTDQRVNWSFSIIELRLHEMFHHSEILFNLVGRPLGWSDFITVPVGYGRLGSPCSQLRGAQTAFEAEILWAYRIRSSELTGVCLALLIDSSFCLAWYTAVDWNGRNQNCEA